MLPVMFLGNAGFIIFLWVMLIYLEGETLALKWFFFIPFFGIMFFIIYYLNDDM